MKQYTKPEVKINVFESTETIAAETLVISVADTKTYSIDTFTID